MKRYLLCVSAFFLGACAVLSFARSHLTQVHGDSFRARISRGPDSAVAVGPARGAPPRRFSLPLVFEPAASSLGDDAQFVARGTKLGVALTRRGIEVTTRPNAGVRAETASINFALAQGGSGIAGLCWHGAGRLPGETNFLRGADRSKWRTHVPHFARVEANDGEVGIAVHARDQEIEYDLSVPPDSKISNIRLAVSGARNLRLDARGDLLMRVGEAELRMAKPIVYEQPQFAQIAPKPRQVDGSYLLNEDGTIAFAIASRDPRAALVIDPVISLAYSSFLGGNGDDAASSIATDSTGKVYIAGTTASPATFPEAATAQLGPGLPSNDGSSGSAREFFIAKIDPAQSGAASLVYLTFLGGSSGQAGGLIAVDPAGDVVITGTTVSADFPVTDSSARTSGANDTIVSKLDSTGSTLLYSTIFGGSGTESQQNAGGIALDPSGRIFIASDTNSPDLPVTPGAYASIYTSPTSDGFLAVFQPGTTPVLKYCSYLGLNGKIGIGGIALDASGNAYIAGYTSDPYADFPLKLAAQPFFGGGALDAFLMKLAPAGNGPTDLVYGTLLGGNGSDQAFAVALDSLNPPNAYITGTTSSANFPVNGIVAAYQTALPSNATSATSDAFVAVIAQSAGTGQTSILYSTYLGGSQKDTGFGIQAPQRYSVYVAGTANSWDFPWRDNFQPFNGDGNAFVAELDTTTPGSGSLIYSTPLGGTSPPGVHAGAQGTAIALDTSGNVWVTGRTTSADFPSAGNSANAFQQICASCQESPVGSDAFVAQIQSNASQQLPSLFFAAPGIPLNFGIQGIGATNVPPQFAAIKNGGEAPLQISSIGLTGQNSSDFSLMNALNCLNATIAPGGMCSFEVGFVPSVAGAEQAFVQVTTNAPGSPQVLEVVGTGAGLAVPLGGINFGPQIVGVTSAPKSVTLTNTSPILLYIDSVQELGANPAVFSFANSAQQCVASATGMAPGASCLVLMTFAPTSTTTFSAEVDISYHLSGEPEHTATIPLSGSGIATAPIAGIMPAALDFGTVTVGTTTGTQIVTLSNTGNAALDISSITLAGANPADFAIVTAGTSPCSTSGGSVAIHWFCTIGVQFAPLTAGARSASLAFVDNAAASPQTVPLTGTALTPPAIQVTPSSLTFAAQPVGTKSVSQQVAIANTGQNPLAINSISIAGQNATDFTETNNCPPSLAVNANCTASVVFQPASPGIIAAWLRIDDNAAGSPHNVALSATATQPVVTLSTPAINFGNQAVGTPSANVSVTVTNSGDGALVFSSLSVVGANAGDFIETDNCSGSAAPGGVAPGSTCTIQITFKPVCGTLTAARSASITLSDNAPGSPQSITLSGTGTGPFCFILPPGGSLSANVSAGQTAGYTLQLEAANGFTGSVNLACAGSPSSSTCSITPTTVNIGGSQIVGFQVNVATSGGTAILWRAPGDTARRGPGPPPQLPTEVVLIAVLLVFGLAERRDRRRTLVTAQPGRARRSRVQRFAILSGAACTFLVLAACGGSSAPQAPPPVDPRTPAGTYTIVVTGTGADTASQSVALSLTVH